MLPDGTVALFAGAVALGAVHGVEPGHGWPVAATYALNQSSKWLHGLAAGLVIGVGHLVSSIAMVAVFFYAKSYFELTEVNEPISLVGGVHIGGPVSLVAGVLLVALGVREYVHGHGHSRGHGDGHSGDGHSADGHVPEEPSKFDPGHAHGQSHRTHGTPDADHSHSDADPGHSGSGAEHGHAHGNGGGLAARARSALPFAGGHSHSHGREEWDDRVDAGLLSIAWFAFVLGFAHEEEFEIIALCAGSEFCLELMAVYALTVIVGIVGLTLLLISGYEHFEEEVDQYTPYLPVFSAVVLVSMGLGFISGLF